MNTLKSIIKFPFRVFEAQLEGALWLFIYTGKLIVDILFFIVFLAIWILKFFYRPYRFGGIFWSMISCIVISGLCYAQDITGVLKKTFNPEILGILSEGARWLHTAADNLFYVNIGNPILSFIITALLTGPALLMLFMTYGAMRNSLAALICIILFAWYFIKGIRKRNTVGAYIARKMAVKMSMVNVIKVDLGEVFENLMMVIPIWNLIYENWRYSPNRYRAKTQRKTGPAVYGPNQNLPTTRQNQ